MGLALVRAKKLGPLGRFPSTFVSFGVSRWIARVAHRRDPGFFFSDVASWQRFPFAWAGRALSQSRAALCCGCDAGLGAGCFADALAFAEGRGPLDERAPGAHLEICREANERGQRMGAYDREPDAATVSVHRVCCGCGSAEGPSEEGAFFYRRGTIVAIHD